MKKRKIKIPNFYIVSCTKAHGSLDIVISSSVADRIRNKGINSKYLGSFKFYEFPNGDIYILKHERRGAWKYKATVSQTDAEGIIMNIHTGIYPKRTKGQLTGHMHNLEGTLIGYKGIDIINVPAFITWVPYPKARTMMHYYQSDIGAWVFIITEDGRTTWQKWLYQPFIYHQEDEKIIEGEPNRTYVSLEDFNVSPHFRKLLEEAKYVAVFIADTHTGENMAPCPEKFPRWDEAGGWGNIVKPPLTIANYRMNACWYHLMYMIKYVFKADELFHLGDPVAGTNPFEKYRNPLMVHLPTESDALAELVNALNFDRKTLKELVKSSLEKSKKPKK